MKIKFTKMHGIGNDYIYLDCINNSYNFDFSAFSIETSKRHFSIGADGVVAILPSEVADAKMRMFNADGSEGKMCGNAIRCVGKYLFDNGIVNKKEISVETLSGIKYLTLTSKNGKVYSVTVNMGKFEVEPKSLPVLSDKPLINEKITVDGTIYRATCVSVGNPHCVLFVDDVENFNVVKIGSKFEIFEIFPEKINTEFVQLIDKNTVKMRVFERGSGETYACGTGACATVAACILNGYCEFDSEVTVKLIGGDLVIKIDSERKVSMTGTATKVYDGVIEYEC